MATVLIIGGGVAGLSAGIYARLSGHRAIVCERHAVAGGNLTGWKRGDYVIDNCIHWLTGTNPVTAGYRTWEDLGALGSVDVIQTDTLYTCESGGNRLSLHKDLSTLERDMLALSPADGKEIRSFIKAVEALQGAFGIAGENHDEKRFSVRSLPLLLKYHNLSTEELSNRFAHPLLKKFIVCFLGKYFASTALLVVFATFCGRNGGLPSGGSPAMAKRIADRFVTLGGELLLKKEALRIRVQNGVATSVLFSDGDELQADYIVATPDAKVIFDKLLPVKMPDALKRQYLNKRMLRFSAYHCAFSCPTDALPFRGDFIYELPRQAQRALRTKYLILREFSHEPSFAPTGKTVLQSLTFTGEKDSRAFIALRKDKAAYARKKQELADAVLAQICEKFPCFLGKLKLLDVWTPATYERYTGAEIGSFMSFLLPKGKLPVRVSGEIPGVKNVILATQWQQAPGGLPTAAGLGKAAAEWIDRKERQATRKPFPFPFAKRKRQKEA